MKDELQNKLVDILSSMQAAASKAGDFAMAQMPDIAQTYVAYGRASSTAGLILGLAILVVVTIILLKGWKKCEDEGGDFFGYAMFGFVASIPGVLITGFSGSTALLVWSAPKVWLLKEIAELLK